MLANPQKKYLIAEEQKLLIKNQQGEDTYLKILDGNYQSVEKV